jgi:predicted RNase H-like HicB family nuclease
MLSSYLNAAMRRARYELIGDTEPYYGEIPDCQGVWATAKSLEDCRRELLETLEGWVVLSLQKGLPLPILDGIVEPLATSS